MSGAADQRSRLAARLAPRLASVRAAALFRRPRIADGPAGVERVVDGHRCLVFCSNDYLGLAGDPDVSAAFRCGIDRWGAGAGSAHLVGGHSRAHHELEEALAEFVDRPRALLFSTGYMANLGIGVALVARGDLVLEDRLNHASLLDAGLVSGARFARFAHGDPAALAERLERRAENRLVMTDGVFSMDGDVAPLPAYAAACARAGADLAVDDAHGLGVLGPGGRGTLAHFGLGVPEVPVLMGTLGKAFGTAGAFVAGETELIEWLIQRARTYVYTTAMPPALAEATRTALALVERGDARRERLRERVARFRQGAIELGLEPMASETPIQPLLVGEAGRAGRISEHLLADGFLVTAIRPPTVPEGTARLRVTLSAAHTAGQVDRLLEALGRAFKREGIEAQ